MAGMRAWPGQSGRGRVGGGGAGAKETLLPRGGLCSAFWTPKCPPSWRRPRRAPWLVAGGGTLRTGRPASESSAVTAAHPDHPDRYAGLRLDPSNHCMSFSSSFFKKIKQYTYILHAWLLCAFQTSAYREGGLNLPTQLKELPVAPLQHLVWALSIGLTPICPLLTCLLSVSPRRKQGPHVTCWGWLASAPLSPSLWT